MNRRSFLSAFTALSAVALTSPEKLLESPEVLPERTLYVQRTVGNSSDWERLRCEKLREHKLQLERMMLYGGTLHA